MAKENSPNLFGSPDLTTYFNSSQKEEVLSVSRLTRLSRRSHAGIRDRPAGRYGRAICATLPLVPIVAALMSATPAWSTTITASTFGPSDAYSSTGDLVDGSESLALTFNASRTGPLASIRLALAFFPWLPENDLTISLGVGDNEPIGTVLESWNLEPTQTPKANAVPPEDVCAFAPAACIITITSTLNPELTTGSSYWLLAESTAVSSYAWKLTPQEGFTGTWSKNSSNGYIWTYWPDDPQTAFEVSVNTPGVPAPIPEPSTFMLLLAGAILTCLRRFNMNPLRRTTECPPSSI